MKKTLFKDLMSGLKEAKKYRAGKRANVRVTYSDEDMKKMPRKMFDRLTKGFPDMEAYRECCQKVIMEKLAMEWVYNTDFRLEMAGRGPAQWVSPELLAESQVLSADWMYPPYRADKGIREQVKENDRERAFTEECRAFYSSKEYQKETKRLMAFE